MLTCPHCHGSFPPGTGLCPHDGSRLEEAAEVVGATTGVDPAPGRHDALSPTLRQESLAGPEVTGGSRERVAARDAALARPDPVVGTTLVGRFKVVRKLGEGGMGVVYEARHTLIDKRVAIKILLDKYAQKETVIARLQQEARLASAIGHPNIVDITDFGKTDDGRTFVVMEYLDGESVAQLIARDGPIAPKRALRIGQQVADALAAAHAKGIIHRDIKPENVFLCERDGEDFVKVVDFGISKHLRTEEEEAEETPRLTQTGMVLGTPLYMSPEQARGEEELDHRIDIYALGVILYEMITNEVPFRGTNYLGIISQVLTQRVVPPRHLRPDLAISEACERVILKAMAKDRDQRYATMTELTEDLGRLMAGDHNVGSMVHLSGVDDGRRTTARISFLSAAPGGGRSWSALLTGVGLIGLGGLVFGLVFFLSGPEAPAPAALPFLLDAAPVAQAPATVPASQPAPPRTVKIRIVSTPAQAEVFVGDQDYGPAPVEVTLPRSLTAIAVRAQLEGYVEAQEQVTPTRDAHIVLALREKKRPPRGRRPPTRRPTKTKTGSPVNETLPNPYTKH